MPISLAVVGAGYWGPNLARNAMALEEIRLKWVCDLDLERARGVVGDQTSVRVTADLDEVLSDESVEALAIATPPATHAELALRCIEAGRHVLVEKPLAYSCAVGAQIVEAAKQQGVVLQCDHTFCYTPAVQRIHDMVRRGELGTLHYYDSVRINLGLVQADADVFWDLAPHDISILDHVLGSARHPTTVMAQGADPLGVGHPCLGYVSLTFDDGLLAHFHVSWLSPRKVRTTILGGSRRMVVWNDLLPSQRLSVFDSGVVLAEGDMSVGEKRQRQISYRVGDMYAPALQEVEALRLVLQEFASAIRAGRAPMTDGDSGLRLLRVIEAIQASVRAGGAPVTLSLAAPA